jgi:glucose-6-phosphate dehydrogenase assembly protein OpcA
LKLLRHAIVQAVDPTVLDRPFGTLHSVTIEAGPDLLASGWLLGGWIASRLGWQPSSRDQSESSTTVTFNAPGGRATLHVRPSAEGTLAAAFETDALSDKPVLRAAYEGDEIVVRYGWDVPPLTLMAPRRSRAELLAAELRNLFVDSYLRDALNIVARIETLRT